MFYSKFEDLESLESDFLVKFEEFGFEKVF